MLLRVEFVRLTNNNNITYAVFGRRDAPPGLLPVSEAGWGGCRWGHARVERSRHPEVVEGARVHGHLPAGTVVVPTPSRVTDQGFADASPHPRRPAGRVPDLPQRRGTDPIHCRSSRPSRSCSSCSSSRRFLVDDFADEHLPSTPTRSSFQRVVEDRDHRCVPALSARRRSRGGSDLGRQPRVRDRAGHLRRGARLQRDRGPSGAAGPSTPTLLGSGRSAATSTLGTPTADLQPRGRRDPLTEMSAGGEHLPGARPTFFAPDRVAKAGPPTGAGPR